MTVTVQSKDYTYIFFSFYFNRMADSSEEEHGTSDEFLDPFCDICYKGKGVNVRVYGYCKDCVQFLCSDCHVMHGNFQLAKGHVILRGANMPQSQADKPPKFEDCDVHPKLLRDEFCSVHKVLVCSSCSSTNHDKCFVGSINDVCKDLNASEIDLLYNSIKTLQDQARSVNSSLEQNIQKLVEEKKKMLKEAQDMYDSVTVKVNNLFQELQSEIETAHKSQKMLILQQQENMDNLINRLEFILTESEKFKGKPIETKLFLKVQELVANTGEIIEEFRAFGKSFCLTSLSFKPGKVFQDLLNRSVTFGSVVKSESKHGTDIIVTDIVFPCSQNKPPKPIPRLPPQQSSQSGLPSQQSSAARLTAASPAIPLSLVKATKYRTLQIQLKDHGMCCDITGMAITKDRKTILVDSHNSKVMMFSHDMKFLSSVSVPDTPRDITALSDKEAVVTTSNKSLIVLDISGSQLSIKTTRHLSYDIQGITRYNDKLIVTSPGSKPPSVKLIDLAGRVYWSVSSDQKGKQLFGNPQCVNSHGDGISSTVIVTNWGTNTLTMLNGDTGEVINRRQVQGKGPRGITTDSTGNVYVCYFWRSEVAVLSGDLSEEKILLSRQNGLNINPQAILYDDTTHRLIISYLGTRDIDYFQVS